MAQISIVLVVALILLAFASGFIAQKTLDTWTQDAGRAPMIHRGRGSWWRYLRSVEPELPPSVRQRIALCNRVGIASMILVPVVVILDSVCHRR